MARCHCLHCILLVPACVPSSSTRLGRVAFPELSTGIARFLLSKMDRRWRLSTPFFTSTHFSPFLGWPYRTEAEIGGAFMTLQNLLHYTWFSIKSQQLCFAMEVIAFSASVPAKSFSKWLHSHSRDLTGLPVSAAISVAAVTFYYRFRKSPQFSIRCEIMQTTLSFFFFKTSVFFSSAGNKYNLLLFALLPCLLYWKTSNKTCLFNLLIY